MIRLFIVFLVGLYLFGSIMISFTELSFSPFNIADWEPVWRFLIFLIAAIAAPFVHYQKIDDNTE